MSFKVGDIVKHKASFLKSIGWYTDVPKNGVVEKVEPFGSKQVLFVLWSDGNRISITDDNVMLASKPDYSGM